MITFEEACDRYLRKASSVSSCVAQPSNASEQEPSGTWILHNANGVLARVLPSGEVILGDHVDKLKAVLLAAIDHLDLIKDDADIGIVAASLSTAAYDQGEFQWGFDGTRKNRRLRESLDVADSV